jgi:hypothetical protein
MDGTMKLDILGAKYSVIMTDLTNSNAMGECYKAQKIIKIHDKLEGEELLSTMIHEVIHAMFYESGLNQTSVNGDIEEIIAEQGSRVITSFFKKMLKKKKKKKLKVISRVKN